jgi:hypothetical protein
MARPRFHALLSVPLAWGSYRCWGAGGAAGALAAGTLVDLDHLVDYAWTRLRREKSHYIAPLHGWELALGTSALALWAQRAARAHASPPDTVVRPRYGLAGALGQTWAAGLVTGLAAGLWLHLVQDLLTNRPRHAGVYALSYRLRHGFKREVTGWGEHTKFHGWSHLPWYKWF